MANNFAAFFETLVAGADEYNKAKVGRTACSTPSTRISSPKPRHRQDGRRLFPGRGTAPGDQQRYPDRDHGQS